LPCLARDQYESSRFEALDVLTEDIPPNGVIGGDSDPTRVRMPDRDHDIVCALLSDQFGQRGMQVVEMVRVRERDVGVEPFVGEKRGDRSLRTQVKAVLAQLVGIEVKDQQ
jgi:hypothetical protein